MKKLILALFILSSFVRLSGQELEFFGHYSGSSYNKFQNNIGYGLAYNHITKSENRIGFIFQHSFFNRNYSDIHRSNEDGISTYILDIDAKNRRIALKMNYAFKIVNKPRSSLFIGPEISLNYFFVNEQVTRYENEGISAANYQSEYTEKNRFGFGFLLEFELKEIISERISISSSVHPEIISYQNAGLVGTYSPDFIGWLNFNLGFKYRLKKD